MDMKIIEQRLETYKPQSRQEEFHCFKEIVQEIALFALSRTDFFKKASFMGGTALRILHGLPRFSEDLDFSLLSPDPKFLWKPYLQELEGEFKAYGMAIEIKDRSELPNAVKRAFLKEHSFGQILSLRYERKKSDSYVALIRLEIDTAAPSQARRESKLVDFPLPHAVVVHDMPTLFAGKINALLTRTFVKGRDWFDFVWYVGRKVDVNFEYLANALRQFNVKFPTTGMTPQECLLQELSGKVSSIDWNDAKQDVNLLLRERDVQSLDLWNADYFHEYIDRMKYIIK